MVADRTGVPDERRTEIGGLLRRRREALSPAALGLPVSPRRRAPGLLREEVAALAGLSTTWYTYLEQGRPIRPSPQVVDSLTRVLELSEDEGQYLRMLVFGHSPATRAPVVPDSVRGVVELMRESDHPFYAGNQDADVLWANPATATWYDDFARPGGVRNMLLWLLTDPGARTSIVDWEADTRDVVSRLRSHYAERMGEPATRRTIDSLSEASPEFRTWWKEQHVAEQRIRLRTLVHPELGRRTYQLVTLRAVGDSKVAFIAHVPIPATDS